VLADAKRGDIASTAAAYAEYFFGDPADAGDAGAAAALPGLGADALTVNPYLGADSLEPFLRHLERGKGIYLLAKTSNPGSRDLQDLEAARPGEAAGALPIYRRVARLAARLGEGAVGRRGYSSVGIVVGGTSPTEAAALRRDHPTLPFLVPGYGAQGAGPEEVAAAFDARGRGAIVNASRSLLFAYRAPQHRELGPERWAEASRRECIAMRDAILGARRASGVAARS
jgi:orotidine-5'-phosphate decarboxylase